jgi:hypothetical protein
VTADRRFERDLPDLLADLYLGPAPDYRDDLVQRFAATSQRPAWTFPERWIPMSVTTLARQALQPLPWRTIGLLVVLALLAAAALVAYVGSQRRLPLPYGPAANGKVVFADAGDIFLLDPVAGTPTLAVGGAAVDSQPAFSRDGTMFAFLRKAEATSEVWVADDHGGNPHRISSGLKPLEFDAGPAAGASMEWSPDGRFILLTNRTDLTTSTVIVATDGSPMRTLELGMRAEGPTWRPPDGSEILFRGEDDSGFGLYAVHPDGSGLRQVVAPVTTDAGLYDVLFYGWSPDGTSIAFQRIGSGDIRSVWVAGADGGTPVAITHEESVGAVWSPDGSRILYLQDSGGTISLHVVNADGTNNRVIAGAFTTAARWSPDGEQILQVDPAGTKAVLFDPDGGPSTPLPATVGGLPDWQRLALTP